MRSKQVIIMNELNSNGLSAEHYCAACNLTKHDSTMQQRCTIPRSALELNNTIAVVPAQR
jgi:hypothetical protein